MTKRKKWLQQAMRKHPTFQFDQARAQVRYFKGRIKEIEADLNDEFGMFKNEERLEGALVNAKKQLSKWEEKLEKLK